MKRPTLFTASDPIGISDIPEAKDEYDAYADSAQVAMNSHSLRPAN